MVWSDINMDFIEGLPRFHGKDAIMVVVDRLSKYAHFIALSHPYTALSIAQLFMDHIFKLHGMPKSIVSDRDPIFVSNFWQKLFKFEGVELNLSSSYHPQSDGQTEVVNRCLEAYLRCVCGDIQGEWAKWLPLAEYWYNTTYRTSTQSMPLEILYGQHPIHIPYFPSDSSISTVDRS
jgi:hypothetical protein